VKRGLGVYPEADLLDKFRNRVLIGRVDRAVLDERTPLIADAARGTITWWHTRVDAGVKGCVGYIFDLGARTYSAVRLWATGDYELVNSSEAAQDSSEWLKGYMEVAGLWKPVSEGIKRGETGPEAKIILTPGTRTPPPALVLQPSGHQPAYRAHQQRLIVDSERAPKLPLKGPLFAVPARRREQIESP
jgi:hypothetical protein